MERARLPSAAPLPPAPPLLFMEADHYGGIEASEVKQLRDRALFLASATHLQAALPLFEAVATLSPHDAQHFSE